MSSGLQKFPGKESAFPALMPTVEKSILGLVGLVESDTRLLQMLIDEPLYKSNKEKGVYTLMARKHKNPDQLKIAIFLEKGDRIIDNSFEIKDGNLFIICKDIEGVITIYQSYEAEEGEPGELVNVEVNTNSQPDTGDNGAYRKIGTIENGEIVVHGDEERLKEGRFEIWRLSEVILDSEFMPNLGMIRTKYGMEVRNELNNQ